MRIAITSGKGGTGKTTVSTGLFYVLARYLNYDVQLLDCDVEEPDCDIFIKAIKTASYPESIQFPQIDKDVCTLCGKCKSACAFNAIVILPPAGFIEIVEGLCHGCGACSYVCPVHAIKETEREIGIVTHFDYDKKDDFIEGRLHVGSTLQTRMIRSTIAKHARPDGIILYDSPPGTSCQVVATVTKSDYVIMVTEPTPFGLYDLKLMMTTVKKIGKKHGVIINKSGLDYHPLLELIDKEGIAVLGRIPFKKEYAMAYSQGYILPERDEAIRDIFKGIINKILNGGTA